MKKTFLGLLLILSYIFIIGFFFTNKMMYIRKKTDEEIINRDTTFGLYNQKDFDDLEKKHFSILSQFGYSIKGSLIAPHESNRYIIICHGVTVNRLNSVKYMNLFLQKGWNVLI